MWIKHCVFFFRRAESAVVSVASVEVGRASSDCRRHASLRRMAATHRDKHRRRNDLERPTCRHGNQADHELLCRTAAGQEGSVRTAALPSHQMSWTHHGTLLIIANSAHPRRSSIINRRKYGPRSRVSEQANKSVLPVILSTKAFPWMKAARVNYTRSYSFRSVNFRPSQLPIPNCRRYDAWL